MRNWLKRIFGRRRRQLQAVETVTEEQLQQIFLAAPDNPLWNATLAVLDSLTVEITNEAIDPKLNDAETKFKLGGVQALLELKAQLQMREEQAREMQEETEQQQREQRRQEGTV